MLPATAGAAKEEEGGPPESKALPQDGRAGHEFETLVTSISEFPMAPHTFWIQL